MPAGRKPQRLHHSSRRACIWALAVLAALAVAGAACRSSGSSSSGEQVPTPVYTATAIAGPRADTLADRAIPICEASFNARVSEGTLTGPVLFMRFGNYIRARLDREPNRPPKWEAGRFFRSPWVIAETADEVRGLVCVRETRVQVGTYTPKGSSGPGTIPAYRLDWQVRLVRWPDGAVVGAMQLQGLEPSKEVEVKGSEEPYTYGEPPEAAFGMWLAERIVQPGVLYHPGVVRAAAVSPDGSRVVTGCTDGAVRIWDAAAATLALSLKGHSGDVNAVAFAPDGALVASAGADKTLRLWDARTGQPVRTLSGHGASVRLVGFSSDGSTLVSTDERGMVIIWRTASGEQVRSFDAGVTPLAFAPDLSLMAGEHPRSSFDKKDAAVGIVDIASGREVAKLNAKEDEIKRAVFSPDAKQILVSAKLGGRAVLWDIAARKQVRDLRGRGYEAGGAGFAPDGSLVVVDDQGASGFNSPLLVWEPASGRLLRALDGHQFLVTAVAFSPDGKTLLSASEDWSVRLWDATALK